MPFLQAVTVEPADINHLGHANNIVYLRWVQEAARDHSASLGLTREAYLARGASFVVRSHRIDYLRPAFAGDRLTVETRVADMGRASSLRKTRILRGTEVLATAETEWAFIDIKRGRATRIPEDVKSRFAVEP